MASRNPNYRSKIYQKREPTDSAENYERPTFTQESSGFCGCCGKSQPRRIPPRENRNAQASRTAFRTKSQLRNPQSKGNINTDDDEDDNSDDEDDDQNDEEGTDRRKQSSGAQSTNSRQPRSSIRNLPNQDQNPSRAGNCCRRCLKCIYQHGSLIGPAAFSFSCCCICCLRSIPRAKFSSYATKIIYLVFLGIVTLFASFFVINYDDVFFKKGESGMAGYKPCVDGKGDPRYIGGWFGDCTGHSGYFMVYRIFLAAVIIFAFLGIFVLGVGTNKDSCRPGVHQGYWCCKLILFIVLVIVFLTEINVGKEGLFDEIMMYFGLTATLLFSLPQIVILMDLVEFIYIRIRESCKYFDAIYWPLTIFIYLIDIGFLVLLGFFYTKRSTKAMGDALNYGSGSLCVSNIALMFYACIVGVVTFAITIVHGFIKNSFYPNASLIHSAVVWFHTLLYIYEAMGNSPDIECRPVWYPYTESRTSKDVCFTLEGCVHTFSVWFLLIYLAVGDAPKTKAPLSLAAIKICCISPPEKLTDDDDYLEENNNKIESAPKTTSKMIRQNQLSQVVVVKPQDDEDDDEIIHENWNYASSSSRADRGDNKDDPEDPEAINTVASSTAPPPSSRPRPSNSSRRSSKRNHKKSSVLTPSEIELRRQRGRFFVQNDEAKKLKYSWSLFHGLLILGALSIMMGMTNFIHPRADGPHASSYPAFWFKILISPVAVAGYLVPIFISWCCYRTSSSNANINDTDNDTDVESTPDPASIEPSQKSVSTKDEVSIEESTVETTASKVNNGVAPRNTNNTTSTIQSNVPTTSKNTTNANMKMNTNTGDNSTNKDKKQQNVTNIKNNTTTSPNDINKKQPTTTTTTAENDRKVFLIPNKKVGSIGSKDGGPDQLNSDQITVGKGNEENNKTKRKRMQSGVVVLQPPPKELGETDFNKF